MLRKTHLICSLTFAFYALSALTVFSGSVAQEASKDAKHYLEKGIDAFNKGFYEALPKKRPAEASQYFDQAAMAFKEAIRLDQNNVEAHRRLARLYYVQKNYLASAKAYQKVTELTPSDLNAYVLTALAYTKARKYDQAIEQLKAAKAHTTDQSVLQKLDEYIIRVEQKKSISNEK